MCNPSKKNRIKEEFLEFLISLRGIKNIDTTIHRLATELAYEYIMKRNGLKEKTINRIAYNPSAGKGPDILLEDKKTGEIYYAEIKSNDSFEYNQQKKELKEIINELLKRKKAKEKYLFVLSSTQVQNVKDILSKRKSKKSNLKKIKIIPLFQESC